MAKLGFDIGKLTAVLTDLQTIVQASAPIAANVSKLLADLAALIGTTPSGPVKDALADVHSQIADTVRLQWQNKESPTAINWQQVLVFVLNLVKAIVAVSGA